MIRPPVDAGAGARPTVLSAAPASDAWIVLADGASATFDRRLPVRRLLVLVGVAALLISGLVGVAGVLVSRHVAEQQAVHDVAQLTDLFAESVVQPALTDQMAADPVVAHRELDRVVRARVLRDSLVRVKIWTRSGAVLYSDEPRLIGQHFALDSQARTVFTHPRTEADVSDLRRPENRFEQDQGKLLEVYRPIWTPSGQPLLFETYFRYDTVNTRSHELWRGFAGIMLSSLGALLLLLLPLVWLVVSLIRRERIDREGLMRRALDASEEERRRIAASLHDGVVQELAGASFTSAAQAERAEASGDPALAAELNTVATTVRDCIAAVRSLLVDIYPASLRTSGLNAALRDLARATKATDAAVSADIDADTADRLPVLVQENVYRVTQESLRNALRHSDAKHIRIRLSAIDGRTCELQVHDDGRGFDAAGRIDERAAAGHFGLSLMTDAARRCGGHLAVSSAPGCGTRIRLRVPRS